MMEEWLLLKDGGICRCCALEGPSKDLVSKYSWMGDDEIYSDMLRECFNITLVTVEEGSNGGICEVCITQLRSAYKFRQHVLHTEEQFKKKLESKILCDSAFVKLEIPPETSDTDMDPMGDNDDNSDYEVPLKKIKDELESEMELMKQKKTPAKTIASKSTRTLKKKASVEPETSKRVGAPRKRKKKKGEASATPERTEHRVNLTAILQYSNASPFRDKTMHGFTCLYCCKHFQHIDDLRQHTAQQSEKDKLNKMIDYKLSYNPIKVDITDLECTICGMQMTDLNDLKEHLAEMHKKVIFKDIKDIILPFRLYDGTNYTCVACSEKHISFKNLYHHMSNHYRNYCCNICGAGYITIAALRKHGKTHEKGNFKCSYCDKVYSSEAKKRNHEKGVHTGGWLRNKCPHCPEIFVSYYDRSEHLVRVHNEKPVTYPCNACNKIYKKKFELNRHIKHHHLQQRNYMCDMCNAKFFSKRGLVDHMSRHLGGDVFNCDVCGRSFSRQRTLRDHMKAHEGDKRFECEICHKNFMQKSSLKSHVRLHQDDLDIFKEFDDVKHLIDDREMTLKQIAAENKKKMEGDRMRNIL